MTGYINEFLVLITPDAYLHHHSYINEAIATKHSIRPLLILIEDNSEYERRKWPFKFISVYLSMLFFLACNMVSENWHYVCSMNLQPRCNPPGIRFNALAKAKNTKQCG